MKLFIDQDLVRKAGAVERRSVHLKRQKTRGELRGGNYIRRVVTGTDKDGSPQYRYIRTPEEYESYLEGQNKAKKESKKQKERGEELAQKTRGAKKKPAKESLFVAKGRRSCVCASNRPLYVETK